MVSSVPTRPAHWVVLSILVLLHLSLCYANFFGSSTLGGSAKKVRQTNLLMIMYDDLRPELSIYGKKHMITPNFERLANRSVVFENSYCQIAVCNPSRDSLLTGLRPDTLKDYGFQNSYGSNHIIPSQLVKSGYKTAGFGKIRHWDGGDQDSWNHNHTDYDWYGYQNAEYSRVNASSFPDRQTPEENFRDYMFASDAINALRQLNNGPNYFMVAVGFKLPHLMVHFPHKYYEMYRDRASVWDVPKKELRFPPSAPSVAYKCCGLQNFAHLHEEGDARSVRSTPLGSMQDMSAEVHKELIWGYSGAISFLDAQLGRILDTLDELDLWHNTTIVLTSDHGMHNGEKALWEKWTLYDESTHVPLIIHHPDSPHKGLRYEPAVESLDVFPTINDILGAPFVPQTLCGQGRQCQPLQGKSLGSVVMGDTWVKAHGGTKGQNLRARTAPYAELKAAGRALRAEDGTDTAMVSQDPFHVPRRLLEALPPPGAVEGDVEDDAKESSMWNWFKTSPAGSRAQHRQLGAFDNSTYIHTHLPHAFALSQVWRCAQKAQVAQEVENPTKFRQHIWYDCDVSYKGDAEVCTMGYSVRSRDFRYTAYLHFDRALMKPLWELPPLYEELYDHRSDSSADLGHRELYNVAKRTGFDAIAASMRTNLIRYLKDKVVYASDIPKKA